jgi:hypothetical protein
MPWKPAFLDKSDNKVLFADKSKFTPYTSEVSGHGVSFRSVIGSPFALIDKCLPGDIRILASSREVNLTG